MITFRKLMIALLALSGAVLAQPSFAQDTYDTVNYVPPEGYVPTAKVAISIALAVAAPIYSRHILESEKPYTATLENGIWIVRGSLKKDYKGGTLECRISKQTGQIVRLIHWK